MNVLEVERLDRAGHVLGRHDGGLDDQQVGLGLAAPASASSSVRWGVTATAQVTPASLIWAMRGADELGLDRLGVDLLQPAGGLGRRAARRSPRRSSRGTRSGSTGPRGGARPADPSRPSSTAVAGDVTLSVGARQDRDVEAVGVDVAGDVDVLGVAGAAAGHDGHLVEPVGPPRRLADADLDLGHDGHHLTRSPGLSRESPKSTDAAGGADEPGRVPRWLPGTSGVTPGRRSATRGRRRGAARSSRRRCWPGSRSGRPAGCG